MSEHSIIFAHRPNQNEGEVGERNGQRVTELRERPVLPTKSNNWITVTVSEFR